MDSQTETPRPRTFEMRRIIDVSGISGVGVVAVGVVFPDGKTVIQWRGDPPSVVVWDHFSDAVAVHGHGGATEFHFHDEEATE